MQYKLIITMVDDANDLIPTIKNIQQNYPIESSRIFVLQTPDKYILSYNLDLDNCTFPKNSFKANRKKDINVLYTVNALNSVVMRQGGMPNRKFEVNWTPFRNCVLLGEPDLGLKIIPTKLYKIIEY